MSKDPQDNSRRRTLAALLSFGLSYLIYRQWFISVWCFFAAVLSGIVLLYFTCRISPSKESTHGVAV